jgi:hypothetical protein
MATLNDLSHRLATAADKRPECRLSDSNVDRAERSLQALEVYADGRRQWNEEAEVNVKDFLTDLMHLCRLNGMDFDAMLEESRRRYQEEVP